MTTAADDAAVEEAFEAYLAGRRAPGTEVRLASFADAVRASATEPGRPNAALAELLTTGLLQDQPGPAARPSRRPRRRRTRMLATALFAKLASAGLAAKAATTAGVVVVGLSTAGFTGNLGPAQHTFATVVDHATPFTAPDSTTQAGDEGTSTEDSTVSTPAVTSPTVTPTETPEDASTAGDTGEPARVTPAHPSNYGGQVSEWAHQKNEDRKSGAATLPAKPSRSASGNDARPGSDQGSTGASDHGSTGGSTGGSDHGSTDGSDH